jgi:hypothetical protein
MPVEEEKNTRKACRQFLQASQVSVDASSFIPAELMTPSVLYDIDKETKEFLIHEVFEKVPKENLLLLILGEGGTLYDLPQRILAEKHDIFKQPIVTEFAGKVSLVVMDPTLQIDTVLQNYPVDSPFPTDKVESITLVKSIFPLTPVYGPHKYVDYPSLKKFTNIEGVKGLYAKQPNSFKNDMNAMRNRFKRAGIQKEYRYYLSAVRRMVYENVLDVLHTIVEHPSPVFLSSRLTKMCYRSFKYILDIRNFFQRQTLVRYEYTKPHGDTILECDDTPIFPVPFQTCNIPLLKNDSSVGEYYLENSTKQIPEEQKTHILPYIERMNTWVNHTLQEKMKPVLNRINTASGKKKNRKNRKTRKNLKH